MNNSCVYEDEECDDRANEVLAMESMYYKEFKVVEDGKFEIYVEYKEMFEKRPENAAKIYLGFEFTEDYPNEPPSMKILRTENLPESAIEPIQKLMLEVAMKHIGCPMISVIVDAVQEWINDYGDRMGNRVKSLVNQDMTLTTEEEEKKAEGTEVTVESFVKWRAEFDKTVERKKPGAVEKAIRKLTGRELFLKDESLNKSDLTFLEEGGEEVKIDESLFQDMSELEINDLEEFTGNNN